MTTETTYEFGKTYNFGCYGDLYFVKRIDSKTIWVTDQEPQDEDSSGWFMKR